MKAIFIIPILLIFTIAASAQPKFGVKAGLTLSTYEASSESGYIADYKNNTGFSAGIFTDLPVSNQFSVQGELSICTQGARNNFTEKYTLPSNTGYTEYTTNAKYKINPFYITSNLYFKSHFRTEYGTLALGTGPMAGYGLSGYLKINGVQYYDQMGPSTKMSGKIKLFTKDEFYLEDENGNPIPVESPDKALFKKLDLGVGTMLEFESKWNTSIGISYALGLRDISNNPTEELRTRSLTIWLGYKF